MTVTIAGFGSGSISLETLGIDLAHGLQLHSGESVAAMHSPPLNPGQPALLNAIHSLDILRRLQRVLLNQYSPDHEVRLLIPGAAGEFDAVAVPLGQLDPETHFAAGEVPAGMLLLVPAWARMGSFESLQETMAHLRSPEGCPWDREQSHESLRPYLLEETYEALDALDKGDLQGLKEELGDLLLQVAFHVQVAVDQGEFQMADVIGYINRKLIHRHPHVWGDVDVSNADDVARNWEAIKKQERRDNGQGKASLLDGVSKTLPALAQSYNYQERAARVGFDWERIEAIIEKVNEEIAEIQSAPDESSRAAEIGDLFFALVNWTRWLNVEPETALREANARFYRRFHYIELAADRAGKPLAQMSLAEMDALWDEAKRQGL